MRIPFLSMLTGQSIIRLVCNGHDNLDIPGNSQVKNTLVNYYLRH